MGKYLFNGIELPELPDWDKETYPYAVLRHGNVDGDTTVPYWVYYCDSRPYVNSDGEVVITEQTGISMGIPTGTKAKYYRFYNTDSAYGWETYGSTASVLPTVEVVKEKVFWSNTDILNPDGSVYLAASDPVGGEPVETKPLYYCKGGTWKRVYRKNNGSWEPVEVAVGNPAEVSEFTQLCAGLSTVDPFIFFTDPHLCEGVVWKPKFHEWMAKVKQVYDATPAKLVICGGDWIGNSDTKEQATSKLSYVREYMDKLFGGNCLLVLGNHDTNYQGTEQLTQEELIELWFKGTNTGKPYYYHDTENARYFVLDTQTDWAPEWTDYCAEQVQWLRANLSDKKNVVVVHIDWLDTDCTSQTALTSAVSSMYGVDLILSGHIHADHELVTGLTVPEVSTTNLQAAGIPTFDLCALDASGNKLHMVRVGHGTNRVIDMEVEE